MASPFNITPASILSNVDLALNLLNGTANFDVVGIYSSQTLQQLFTEARPTKATVRETSKVMDHPVETNVVLSDHHIIDPKEIDLVLVIPARFYSSTYEQIKSVFINATLLSVQTKSGVYPNMIVQAMPHDEDPEMYDVITMTLRLREVLFVAPASIAQPNAPANYAPKNPVNSNTVSRGQQTPASQTRIINGSAQTVVTRI